VSKVIFIYYNQQDAEPLRASDVPPQENNSIVQGDTHPQGASGVQPQENNGIDSTVQGDASPTVQEDLIQKKLAAMSEVCSDGCCD
jgi:hypothetical protein